MLTQFFFKDSVINKASVTLEITMPFEDWKEIKNILQKQDKEYWSPENKLKHAIEEMINRFDSVVSEHWSVEDFDSNNKKNKE